MKLIDKDAVLAEIDKIKEGLLRNCNPNPLGNSQECLAAAEIEALDLVVDSVKSLEVKEVELDMKTFGEEMTNVFNLPSDETTNTEEEPLNWEYAIAKHFFELGLKAKKGE